LLGYNRPRPPDEISVAVTYKFNDSMCQVQPIGTVTVNRDVKDPHLFFRRRRRRGEGRLVDLAINSLLDLGGGLGFLSHGDKRRAEDPVNTSMQRSFGRLLAN